MVKLHLMNLQYFCKFDTIRSFSQIVSYQIMYYIEAAIVLAGPEGRVLTGSAATAGVRYKSWKSFISRLILYFLTIMHAISPCDHHVKRFLLVISLQDYPWVARIFTENSSLICGGVIIKSDQILTAASCLFDSKGEELETGSLQVIAGDYKISSPDESEQIVTVAYLRRFSHV